MREDPGVDMILLQEAVPREPGSARSEKYIKLVDDYIVETPSKPIAFVTLTSHGQTAHSRNLRANAPHVSFLQEANKALRAIAATARRAEVEALVANAPSTDAWTPPDIVQDIRARAAAGRGVFALDEVLSKALIAAYGIPTAREALAGSRDAALEAAQRIGYPVVLKAVCASLTHKSDVGAVMLDIKSGDELASAWARIESNLASHGFRDQLDGMLVSEMVKDGLELVMGIHRDPEMGLVIMAGPGGVLLELARDVAFVAPPVTIAKARDLFARTRAASIAKGFRGGVALDEGVFCEALVALGRLALDLSDVIESIDINPFLLTSKGGVAVDALVALRGDG
jgi:acyl-CoA synthetase (NDP forming)